MKFVRLKCLRSIALRSGLLKKLVVRARIGFSLKLRLIMRVKGTLLILTILVAPYEALRIRPRPRSAHRLKARTRLVIKRILILEFSLESRRRLRPWLLMSPSVKTRRIVSGRALSLLSGTGLTRDVRRLSHLTIPSRRTFGTFVGNLIKGNRLRFPTLFV